MTTTLKVSPKGHIYSARPSRPDHRDYGFPALLHPATIDVPPKAAIDGPVGDTKDQGPQGSCTGHGATSEAERLNMMVLDRPYTRFSPAFAYAMERIEENGPDGINTDSGAEVRTSLVVGAKYGFCPEDVMPYDPNVYNVAPTDAQLAEAKKWPGGPYHSLGNNINNIKACILSGIRPAAVTKQIIKGYTFVIGIAVYDSFEAESDLASGLIPFPNVSSENLLGYHEVHAGMEYDDSIQCPGAPNPGAVLIQNSWGTGWGIVPPGGSSKQRGFGWIAYDYLSNPGLTTDVRMQHLGKVW